VSESSIDRVGVTAVPVPAEGVRRARVFGDAAKRVFDVAVAGLLLVIAAPVAVACSIAIKLESPGPVFYGARRVGRFGQDLRVLKFRKMHQDAGGHALTGDDDARFTRIGRFLARTKLDELPQLWNVVTGQMSLVGPRPEDPGFVALHEDAYREILTVRPGVTGLCQLAFAREVEILDPDDRVGHYVDRILPQKVHLDVLYAKRRTFRGDLRILLWTVLPVVVRADVAVNRRTGQLTVRRRSAKSRSTRGRR
jgi:lipopolysaccharide/colanic/teichoic acid biosynthesis glycosyltransferase